MLGFFHLLFWGDINRRLRAFDADDGKILWEVPVGGMVEIPAAALALGLLTKRLDFLSVGTNDLIQYTLAIDRTDDSVAHLYDPLHPAVLTLVASTIQTATRGGVPVAVMQGRVPLYEGSSADAMTGPLRLFRRMGAKTLAALKEHGAVYLNAIGGAALAIFSILKIAFGGVPA